MSFSRPTAGVTPKVVHQVLALLAIMEEPDFSPYTWTPMKEDPETGVHYLPYPTYSDEIDQLLQLAYRTSLYFHPYDSLPEDPLDENGSPLESSHIPYSERFFECATLNQVRRYILLCSRGERFCSGYIAGEWDSGAFLAALRRFRDLMRPAYRPLR